MRALEEKEGQFVDGDGNIIVPKAVRPIVGLKETALGSKKGASRQFRHGNLHVREYDAYYTVHMDRVDPRVSPLGHLLADAPEYVAGAAAAVEVGKRVGAAVYRQRRKEGKSGRDAAVDAVIAGCLAGSSAGRLAYSAVNLLKNGKGKGGRNSAGSSE